MPGFSKFAVVLCQGFPKYVFIAQYQDKTERKCFSIHLVSTILFLLLYTQYILQCTFYYCVLKLSVRQAFNFEVVWKMYCSFSRLATFSLDIYHQRWAHATAAVYWKQFCIIVCQRVNEGCTLYRLYKVHSIAWRIKFINLLILKS